MTPLLRDAWRAVLPSSFDSRSQTIQYALLPQFKTAVLCFLACGWDFYREIAHPATCNARFSWRTVLLIAPQAMVVVAYFLQCLLILRYKRRLQRVVVAVTMLLFPLAFAAAVHTAFRASVSLCCCSELLCPMSAPDQEEPNTKACSLFFSNCYWALLRKITHFAATMGMLSPLIALRLSAQTVNSQDQAAHTHMQRFFEQLKRTA